MKRWIIIATVLGVLLMATVAVWASPINVGGNFSALGASTKDIGPDVYKGNGNPQGVPFQAPDASILLVPINVGGN